jgi:hypothetical protein
METFVWRMPAAFAAERFEVFDLPVTTGFAFIVFLTLEDFRRGLVVDVL